MKRNHLILVFTVLAFSLRAQIPTGYYDPASGLTGDALKTALHNIIDGHTEFPYTSSSTDTWDILKEADRDPNNANNVIGVYSGFSMNGPAEYNGGNGWNREHVWAKSRGDFGTSLGAGTDCHHLRAADISTNSARSNRNFAESTTQYIDQSGQYSGATQSFTGPDFTWEPRASVKGDIARSIFYMATRYEGTNGEPDLELTEQLLGVSDKSPLHGKLSDLLNWHTEDPVDAAEQARNEVIFGYQNNRNPFIDHPEYVNMIWGNGSGGSTGGGNTGGGNNGGGSTTAGSVFINEIHYDNSGSDTGEAVELAGTAGVDLGGWSLVFYNGNGGSTYKTTNLSGVFSDQSNGYGFISFNVTSIQNGAPDGMALVNSQNEVVQFLSYEGTMTASGGPANGMSSENIGVSETSSTPVGHSLQLTGSGSNYSDFSWASPASNTFGSVNNNQSFTGGGTSSPTNEVPSVSITSPSPGSTFTDGAVVTIEANATDTDGTIASVTFFVDGVSIGSDTSSPFSINWTATVGTFSLTAAATDNDGATTTSGAVSITGEANNNTPSEVILTYDDFENGFGNYSDGGSDVYHYSGEDYAYRGEAAIGIQDNSGVSSSFTHTNGLDVTGLDRIEVEFFFYPRSMETNEDFWLRYFDGSTWHTVATWTRGVDFSNNNFYSAKVTVNTADFNFPTNARFRFQCDASANADDVYIDEVTVTGFSGSSAGARSVSKPTKLTTWIRSGVEKDVPTIEDEVVMEVYPNPVVDRLKVVMSMEAEEAILRLTDLNGKVIMQKTTHVQNNRLEAEMPVFELRSGLYLLHVVTANKRDIYKVQIK